jgi:hypothetical protein
MASSRRDTAKKTKPGGKPLTTKPTMKSQFKTFHSNAAEVGALVKELKKHLNDKTQEFEGVSEETWTQWNSQARQISEDISIRRISYANALPILRMLAIKTKFKGAKQNGPKGTWKYAQDVHDAANARCTPTPAGKNKLETEKPGRGSPNLLASSQESKDTATQDLEANPFYTEEVHTSDNDGSHSSQIPGNIKEDENIKDIPGNVQEDEDIKDIEESTPKQDKVAKTTPQPPQQVTYREISEEYVEDDENIKDIEELTPDRIKSEKTHHNRPNRSPIVKFRKTMTENAFPMNYKRS